MREIDAQIQDLRTSPRARRALEARVCHHLSKRSNRYGRRGRGRSVCSTDSVGSIGSNGSVEAGGAEGQADDHSNWQERSTSTIAQRRDVGSAHGGGGSTSRKTAEQASVSERVAAQTLHAQEVLQRRRCVNVSVFRNRLVVEIDGRLWAAVRVHPRRLATDDNPRQYLLLYLVIRAIEEERSKQVRERSAILKEEARRPRDKRAERKRAEALMTIVACAIGVSQETIDDQSVR